VDAAWKLGTESGDDALTIRNIASHVGISPALLYTYFEGKGALMREMQSMATPQLEAYLATAADTASSPNEALFRLCVAYVEFAREHRWLYSMTVAVDDSDAANRSIDAFVVRAVELLKHTSEGAEHDPATRALQLRIALAGLAEAHSAGAFDMRPRLLSSDQRSFVESYVRMLLRGV
jgi:AcrR family transcriptional regulator